MPIPTSKIELIEAINTDYAKLKEDLADIPHVLTTLADLEGHAKGTKMSVNNLLAYLIGWGQLVLKWYDKKQKGELITFPDEGYQWNQLGLLAQQFYTDYEADDFHTLIKKLDQTVADILDIVNKTEEETLYGMAWYKNYTMGRMIQLNTSSPYKNARTRLRRWKREQRPF